MSETPMDLTDRIEIAAPDDSIILRQLALDDAQAYFDLIDQDREHYSQFDDVTAKTYRAAEDVKDSIRNQPPNKYRFGIWDNDALVGSNNITIYDDGSAEIAFWVGTEYTGSGYAARALKPLINFAFGKLDLSEVFTRIVIGNEASRRSVEKAGFSLKTAEDGHWVHTRKRDNDGG